MGLITLIGRLKDAFVDARRGIRYVAYPAGAVGTQVTDGGGAWTDGAWVQILAAGAVLTDLVLTHIQVDDVSVADVQHEVSIGVGAGAAEVEVARVQCEMFDVEQCQIIPLGTAVRLATNVRIAARQANTAGGGTTARVHIIVATGLGVFS